MDPVPGFPTLASPPARRLETVQRFRARGILTEATVRPLLPVANPKAFAHQLDKACDRVILDHYLIGDGSPNSWRTNRTTFANQLEHAGFGASNEMTKLWEIRDVFAGVLEEERVLIGCEGFKAERRGPSPCQHGYKHVESMEQYRKRLTPLFHEKLFETPNRPLTPKLPSLSLLGRIRSSRRKI
jgi:DNA repair photolyase